MSHHNTHPSFLWKAFLLHLPPGPTRDFHPLRPYLTYEPWFPQPLFPVLIAQGSAKSPKNRHVKRVV
eukprot:12937746-Prorocentrum_lima.AAC.1